MPVSHVPAAGRLLVAAASRIQRVAQAHLDPFGLKLAHWPLMLALSQRDAMSQTELAAFSDRTKAAVSLVLHEMQTAGLVERRANPASRRETLVSLTKAGRSRFAETADMWRHANAAAYAGLSKAEIATFTALIERITSNLDRALSAAPPAARRSSRKA